jgi:decaprenylphospho-beta-D-ribofuranose 2-oxidase
VSFADILQYLLPRGFFPPVTPGTKFITVGGAIASDVHGKNHHRDGTFSNFVLDFELLLPSGQTLSCSRTANSEIFWATVGGMGLTGIVLSARVQLRRVETAHMLVDYQKAGNINEALDLFADSDEDYQYSVAWIDSLATGKSLGRSVVMRGNHATAAQLPGRMQKDRTVSIAPRWNIPCPLPNGLLNRWSIKAFNHAYYLLHKSENNQLLGINEFFYPLDVMRNWNLMYGSKGFTQYQIVLPIESGREGLISIIERLAKSRQGSFLGVLKRFGNANAGLLSFPLNGYTLALDIPVRRDLPKLLDELDRIVLSCGGRVYLAKDALLTPQMFGAMYPRLGEFRAIKKKLDPWGHLSSSLARRLEIVSS